MEILGVLGCGFGPDYAKVIPMILGRLVLVVFVSAAVALMVVAMRQGRTR